MFTACVSVAVDGAAVAAGCSRAREQPDPDAAIDAGIIIATSSTSLCMAPTVPEHRGQCHTGPVPRAVVAVYLGCALIWGTTWYAIRVSIAAYPTLIAVALRFAIAAAILLPLAARIRPWPRARTWGGLAVAGALDATAYLLVYLGEERVPGAVAAVLYGTQPLILALLLTATRIERLTQRHMIGAVVSL